MSVATELEQKRHSLDRIIGQSPAMIEVKALLSRVASSPASTVLLLGESGTGKDQAAKVVHHNSARAGKPFMNITCSALPPTLLESELFGHEKGAFTDAKLLKRGLLELAHGGTVFLDEFCEMSPSLQAKLLRFLEERAFKRIGGSEDIQVDVRVIAATNRNLDESVRSGQLREDLYYRLMVLPIRLPPLRDRHGDIPVLAKHFVDRFNREFRKQVVGISHDAMELLQQHSWEGNVREFKNTIERAMIFIDRNVLTAKDLGMLLRVGDASTPFRLPPGGIKFDELELSLVRQALSRAEGNRTRAAALLGMTRDQIRYRIRKFGLHKTSY